jgi:hypothetical protein
VQTSVKALLRNSISITFGFPFCLTLDYKPRSQDLYSQLSIPSHSSTVPTRFLSSGSSDCRQISQLSKRPTRAIGTAGANWVKGTGNVSAATALSRS